MRNLELTELIAIIFCTNILYFVISTNSLYLDTGPLWIPAFVLKGLPCLNKVFSIFHFLDHVVYAPVLILYSGICFCLLIVVLCQFLIIAVVI